MSQIQRKSEFWRSLNERECMREHDGVPPMPSAPEPARWDELDRRNFLRFMGASMALGGLTACTRQPLEKIVPYVKPPEEAIPGKPLFFASTYGLGGYGQGVLVESHLGRPTKIEGNPNHPASLGGTDVFAQASVLDLYDPDRSQTPRQNNRVSTWQAFLADLAGVLADQSSKKGAGLHILSESTSSPTLHRQIREVREAFPQSAWHQYEPVNRDNTFEGAKQAFGRVVEPVYHIEHADVIVSLDADFLVSSPGFARYASDFAARRDPGEHYDRMCRLFAVEPSPTVTGTAADHRLPIRFCEVEQFARALARRVGVDVDGPDHVEGADDFLAAAADDLLRRKGTGLVVVGDAQPVIVHVLAHSINDRLKNIGKTITLIEPVVVEPTNHLKSIRSLTDAMNAGKVELLLILGGNPVFNAPADLGFPAALEKVPIRVHQGLYVDETARLCHWHIPGTHYLEAWSDARAFDGTASIVQPLIEPLYGGKSVHDILAALAGKAGTPGYDLVRETWLEESGDAIGFESRWRNSLHDGVISGTSAVAVPVTFRGSMGTPSTPVEAVEIVFRADPSIHDGRFANNGWLQELPRPVTKLTWDNAALMSPATAKEFGVQHHLDDTELVSVAVGDTRLDVPVLVLPGHADRSVTLHLGYGRKYGGRAQGNLDEPVGTDVYPLRTTGGFWQEEATSVKKAKGGYKLATTQHHPTVQESATVKDRHHFRRGAVGELEAHPDKPEFVHGVLHAFPESLTFIESPVSYDKGNKWGMVIDLNRCIGCNACTIACQAENNIPVVGKAEVMKGRELHWIRVDRWWEGSEENPDTYHMPLTCMQCENAPCELVCPVGATVHGAEGLNQMVYNRCVGTRYCSNNCPYKVRRFNFFKYANHESEQMKMVQNPDVTVRYRGVMEKCTYCVQRINAGRIEAKKDGNRPIRDGEVVAACQQACPTGAIAFGNLNDETSEVAKKAKSPLNYGVLPELNTRPRTTYLAKLKNPHSSLAPETTTLPHHGGESH